MNTTDKIQVVVFLASDFLKAYLFDKLTHPLKHFLLRIRKLAFRMLRVAGINFIIMKRIQISRENKQIHVKKANHYIVKILQKELADTVLTIIRINI